jgi:hypothetical protein
MVAPGSRDKAGQGSRLGKFQRGGFTSLTLNLHKQGIKKMEGLTCIIAKKKLCEKRREQL